jgi:serine/threonine protein kinase
MTIEAGRVLNDRYRLVRPVGQGAQAAVWVADHLALSTHVAVKLIDPELAKKDDARERFRREATAAAQLRSAHVVQILDHGIDDGQPFIVMELLEGEDLFERIEKLGRLSLKETSTVVTQVARALARAHSAGIVHRDLKPENVFLVPNEDDEIAKVLDFGVAKVTSPAKITMQRTGVGTLLGTPHYMSPEQVKGVTEVDFRTDLWALGVIAYQCVTGDLPFDSEGVGDLLLKITVGEMPIPSKVVPGLPATFDAWFAKACQRDPSKRFDSARDMADALARAVGMADKRPATIPRPTAARTNTPTPDSEPPPSAGAPSSKRAKPPPPPPPAAKPKPAAASSEGEAPRKALRPPIPAAGRKRASRPPVEVLDSADLEEAVDGDEVAVALAPLSLRSQLESTDVSFDEGEGSSAAPIKAPAPAAIPAKSAAEPEAPAIEPEPPAKANIAPPAPIEASSPPSSRRAAVVPVEAPLPAPAPSEPQQPAAPVEAAMAAPPRAAPPAPPPRPAPAPPSVRAPDTSRPAHSTPPSTVSGLASSGDTYIPPEFDGSRRKRTLGFVVFGFIAAAAAIAWLSVRPYLQPPPPGPAIPPPTEAPSVAESAPPVPVPTTSVAEPLPSAVDPGRPRAPGSITSEPTTTAPKPKGRWKKKDDVEFVIPEPHPED